MGDSGAAVEAMEAVVMVGIEDMEVEEIVDMEAVIEDMVEVETVVMVTVVAMAVDTDNNAVITVANEAIVIRGTRRCCPSTSCVYLALVSRLAPLRSLSPWMDNRCLKTYCDADIVHSLSG